MYPRVKTICFGVWFCCKTNLPNFGPWGWQWNCEILITPGSTNISCLENGPWMKMYFLMNMGRVFQPAMLVAGTVPWSLCILQENRGTGGGVGWGWWHSCTCTHVRCSATAGLGWGWWHSCTCTHVRCSAHKTGVRLRLASIDAANSQSWGKNVSFALWKTNYFCRATRNYICLQSHVFVGHRDLETGMTVTG